VNNLLDRQGLPDQPVTSSPDSIEALPPAADPTDPPDPAPAPAARQRMLLPLLLTALLTFGLGFGAGFVAYPLLQPAPIADAPAAPAAPDQAAVAPDAVEPDQQGPSDADRAEFMQTLLQQTRHFRGDPNAPVTLIEFSDFQCPYCGRHMVETVPQLDDTFVNASTLRVGYFPVAFLGEQSLWAAEAAECAADQDAFWEYHNFLFNRLAVEGKRDFSRENLKLFAAELGLEQAAFAKCMDTEQYAQRILSDTSFAQQIGVRSTPTFLINGYAVIGAQPFSAFQTTIDDVLGQE